MNLMSNFMDITPKEDKEVYFVEKTNPFELFDKIFNHTITTKEMLEVNEFLLHTLLSGTKQTLDLANFLNCTPMEIQDQIKFLQSAIPKGSKFYYPKKPKIKFPKLVQEIENMFNVNENTAIRYSETMSKKDLKYIKEQMREF